MRHEAGRRSRALVGRDSGLDFAGALAGLLVPDVLHVWTLRLAAGALHETAPPVLWVTPARLGDWDGHVCVAQARRPARARPALVALARRVRPPVTLAHAQLRHLNRACKREQYNTHTPGFSRQFESLPYFSSCVFLREKRRPKGTQRERE